MYGEEVCEGEVVFWGPCVEAVCRRGFEVGNGFLTIYSCGFLEMRGEDGLPDLVSEFLSLAVYDFGVVFFGFEVLGEDFDLDVRGEQSVPELAFLGRFCDFFWFPCLDNYLEALDFVFGGVVDRLFLRERCFWGSFGEWCPGGRWFWFFCTCVEIEIQLDALWQLRWG